MSKHITWGILECNALETKQCLGCKCWGYCYIRLAVTLCNCQFAVLHSGAFVWSTSQHQKDWATLGFPWLVFRVCVWGCPMCLCSADMEMVHGYGVRTGTQSTNVKGYRDLFHHRNNNARCHAPHAHYSHLILILAYGEIVSIPFTDHCEYSSKGQEWIYSVCCIANMPYFETLLHAQWCHAGGDVSLYTSLSWHLLYCLAPI